MEIGSDSEHSHKRKQYKININDRKASHTLIKFLNFLQFQFHSQNIELTQRLLKLQQFLRASDQMSQIDTVWKAFVADMKRIIAESAIK